MATKAQAVAQITAPKIETVVFQIRGTAPFVQARFSAKAMNMMKSKMLAGSTSNTKKAKAARDFNDDFEQAKHKSTEGWVGIPASAFRQAIISACRLVGFKMTLAKLSVFIEADGFDSVDGIPLIKLDAGEPEMTEMAVRNATGVADIRVRPMWRDWGAKVRIKYDADQFTLTDVTNLLARVGMQVGIGEGRPDSKSSAGLGWGTFELV
jgi:glutaredoxin-related protein